MIKFNILVGKNGYVLCAAVLRIHDIFGVDPDQRIHASD